MEYALYDNKLTTDDLEDRTARPVDVKMNSKADLIKLITGPGSILKPTETEAVIDSYWRTITDFIRQGETYSDDYISMRFDITGAFENDDDQFDPTRHSLVVGALLKASVTDGIRQVKMKKVSGRTIAPEISYVFDWGTESNNNQLTPDDILEISGDDLKLHNNLPEEGVYFINQANGSETKAVQFRTNEPKTLTLRIPQLQPGTYRIEVRNTSYTSKSLRVGIFSPNLTVA